MVLAPPAQGPLAMFVDIFVTAGEVGCCWHLVGRAREVAQQVIRHRTALSIKTDPAPSVI